MSGFSRDQKLIRSQWVAMGLPSLLDQGSQGTGRSMNTSHMYYMDT